MTRKPPPPLFNLTKDEGVWLLERARELRIKGGLTKDGADRQAVKELLQRRAERPAPPAPAAPPSPKCARCGKDPRPLRNVGSVVVGACGHPQRREAK